MEGKLKPCVIGVYCSRHGFYHGAEAEELREKIERELPDSEGYDDPDSALARAIRRVLERVDARDSLAWCEFRARNDDPEPPRRHHGKPGSTRKAGR